MRAEEVEVFAVEGLGGLLPPGLEGLSTGSPPCVRGTGDLEKIWMLGWSLWKELSKSWHKTDPWVPEVMSQVVATPLGIAC